MHADGKIDKFVFVSSAEIRCRTNTGVDAAAHWHSARVSLKRLSAGPGFNPQTRQNKLFHDYLRACFEINFSDRQEGLTVSSIIRDR